MPYFSGGMPSNPRKVANINPPTIKPAMTPYFKIAIHMSRSPLVVGVAIDRRPARPGNRPNG
jgi:hypothetical protein